jgi:hypothetical protein
MTNKNHNDCMYNKATPRGNHALKNMDPCEACGAEVCVNQSPPAPVTEPKDTMTVAEYHRWQQDMKGITAVIKYRRSRGGIIAITQYRISR